MITVVSRTEQAVGDSVSTDRQNVMCQNRPSCVQPNFMIQGGDFTRGDGTGGESIYKGKFKVCSTEFFRRFHNAISNLPVHAELLLPST